MKGRLAYIIHFLILFAVLVLQSSPIIRKISVAGAWPNMLFVLIFIYALYFKDSEVVFYAFIFGSVIDLMFGTVYGINALLLVAFSCLFFWLNRFIYSESSFTVFLYVTASSLLFEGIMYIINLNGFFECGIALEMAGYCIAKSVYTAVFAVPVYVIARKIHFKKQEVRRP